MKYPLSNSDVAASQIWALIFNLINKCCDHLVQEVVLGTGIGELVALAPNVMSQIAKTR